jgi:hypothetical protein
VTPSPCPDPPPYCRCSSPDRFRIRVDVQPSLGTANDIVANVCRRGECFELTDGNPGSSSMRLEVVEVPPSNVANTRSARVFGS